MDIYRQLRLFLDETNHGLSHRAAQSGGVFPKRASVVGIPRRRGKLSSRARRLAGERSARHAADEQAHAARRASRRHPASVGAECSFAAAAGTFGNSMATRRRWGAISRFGSPDPATGQRGIIGWTRFTRKRGRLRTLQALLKAHKAARYRAVEHLTPEAAPDYGRIPRPVPGRRSHSPADAGAAVQAAGIEH